MAKVETNKWYKTRYGFYSYYILIYRPKYKGFGDVFVGYRYRGDIDFYKDEKFVFDVMWSGSYDMPEEVDEETDEKLNEITSIKDINHYKYLQTVDKEIVRTIFEDIDVSKVFSDTKIVVRDDI
jgi:hypothetical protein